MQVGNTIPETTVACGGCGEDVNLLAPHLSVQIKAERRVLVSQEAPATEGQDGLNVPEANIYLGTKSGRGRIVQFHDFDCLADYAGERSGQTAKIEYHAEEGDPFVPDDNRTPEELVEAGELPEAALAFHKAMANEGGED